MPVKPRYAYHLTYRSDLKSIARSGLRIQSDVSEAWDNEPAVYFVPKVGVQGGAPYDSESSVWLRFPWPEDAKLPKRGEVSSEFRTRIPVDPSKIEVLQEGSDFPNYESRATKWNPIKARFSGLKVGLSGVRCAGGRTDPALWERSKQKARDEACRSGTRRCGTWDARMAQRAGALYRKAGGKYCGPKTTTQQALTRWTKEEWTTATGKKACRREKGRIVCDRYLPKAAWTRLTAAEKAATRAKKKAGRGQFVANTAKAKKAGRKARR